MRTLLPLLALLAACGPDLDGDGSHRRDCDDTSIAVHPHAAEVCNGIDDDCDGLIDEDVAIVAFWDRDGDGFGDTEFARRVCELPEDGSLVAGDCDDLDAAVNPDQVESCNQRDDDCNGAVDDAGVQRDLYTDADGDGDGAGASTAQGCGPQPGLSLTATDCDDADPARDGLQAERCDGVDNNCNGAVDEGAITGPSWVDADGDGFGDPNQPTIGCGDGAVGNANDCDDTDPLTSPNAAEVLGNGVSDDCDRWIDELAVPGAFASLAEAVAGAPDGSVIQLGAGTWMQAVDLTGHPTLTLAGAGCDATVLYGDGVAPVVSTDGADLYDLTVAGGTAEHGGGLRVLGDTVASGLCVQSNRSSGSGGGVAVEIGHLDLRDSRVSDNQSARDGGGVWVAEGATLSATRVDLRNNLGGYGGGLAVDSADAALRSVVFAGNRARISGGAFSARNPLGQRASAVVGSYLTVVGNLAQSAGTAVHNYGSVVQLDHAVLAHHAGTGYVLNETSSHEQSESFVAIWDNAGPLRVFGDPTYAIHTDPTFVRWSQDLPASAWDLRLAPGSALIHRDADALNPDGTPTDLGAYGGPDASPDGTWSYTRDTDADGLIDGWELREGLNPWLADANADADTDGLAATQERDAGSHPLIADSDGDGVTDGEELTLGTNPADARDHQPTPVLADGRWVRAGDPIALDGSASWAADDAPLAYSWTVTPPAGGSASAWTASGDHGTLTPDATGEWVVSLTVASRGVERTRSTTYHAVQTLTVPGDYPDLAAAIASAPPRATIELLPGRYVGAFDLAGKDLTILGLGDAADVVLDANGAGSVITATQGETLTLANLTLTGGDAKEGGGLLLSGDSTASLQSVRVTGNRAERGGGVLARGGSLTLLDVDLDQNLATTSGGGLFSEGANVSVTRGSLAQNRAPQGGGWTVTGTTAAELIASNTSFDRNEAQVGAAIYVDATRALRLRHAAITGNIGEASVLHSERPTLKVESSLILGNTATNLVSRADSRAWFTFVGDAQWGNAVDALSDHPDDALEAAPHRVTAPPLLYTWLGDDQSLLAPLPTSPLRDAGHPETTDRDRSRADIGPWGGPLATWRADLLGHDGDHDGLDDLWETLTGLNPAVDDAAADLDGDGLTNAQEQALATRPDLADSDSDGVSDTAEQLAGTDPISDADHRPTARAGVDRLARVGDPAPLDASASFDPNGDPLTFSWTFADQPAGSAMSDADLPTGATGDFTPTHRGTYVLALTVSDGASVSRVDTLTLTVAGELRVPEDVATLSAALAQAVDGDVLVLGAGNFDAELQLSARRLTVRGAGADQTTVRSLGASPVATVSDGGDLVLESLTVTGGVGDMGGGVVCTASALTLRQVRVSGNAGYTGGGVGLSTCEASFVDVDVTDNASTFSGGGLYVRDSNLTWTRGELRDNRAGSSGGGLYISGSSANLRNVGVIENLAKSSGGAIYQSGTELLGDHLAIVRNDGRYGAWYVSVSTGRAHHTLFAENVGYALYVVASPAFTTLRDAWYVNESASTPSNLSLASAHVLDDPRLVGTNDLHLRYNSPLRDAGDSACFDLDGTRCDIGVFGGADAGVGFDSAYVDSNSDGMPDAWAQQYAQSASGDDTDGDGLSAADELLAGTDPTQSDTDGDGLSDSAEVAGGTDPLTLTVPVPVAVVQAATTSSAVGTPITLDGSGSATSGGALTYSWALVARPGRSTAALSDPSAVAPTLTPDVPGAYVLTLTVADGARRSAPAEHTLRVAGEVRVPEDYASVAAAVDAAVPGEPIRIAAGTWPARLHLDGRALTLLGAGRDQTLLDAEQLDRVITASQSEVLRLEGLTLTGGVGELGGAVFLSGGAATLTDVAVRDNLSVQGGAVYAVGATLTLEQSAFTGNEASRYGGALSLDRSDTLARQVVFAGNRARTLNGGAVYASMSPLELDQIVFHDNSALYGGALYITGSSTSPTPATMSHVTATLNRATMGGGFVRLSTQALDVRDSVIAHTPSGSAVYLSSASAGTYTQSSSILFDSVPKHTTNTTDPTGASGNLDADPRLAAISDDGDWTNDDWSLLPGSPALGSSSDLGPSGGVTDRGALGGPGGAWTP